MKSVLRSGKGLLSSIAFVFWRYWFTWMTIGCCSGCCRKCLGVIDCFRYHNAIGKDGKYGEWEMPNDCQEIIEENAFEKRFDEKINDFCVDFSPLDAVERRVQ